MLVHPSSFCWNFSCVTYGKVSLGNVRRFGRTKAGTQRYQCGIRSRTFVETIGTVFYGRHHSQETILECLALLAKRNSLAAIHRIKGIKGIKEETIMDWLRTANFKLTRAEFDVMGSYVGHKGKNGYVEEDEQYLSGWSGLNPELTRNSPPVNR